MPFMGWLCSSSFRLSKNTVIGRLKLHAGKAHNGEAADLFFTHASKSLALNIPKGETMQKRIAFLVFAILTLTLFASAQASPPASATCDLGGGKTIKTDYSSPRAKGREIYGGLVPYGEVWRTGANSATTFVTSADVTVGGKTVPAGNYTLFTPPTAHKST